MVDCSCLFGIMTEPHCGKHKQIDVPEQIDHGPDKAAAVPAGIFESRVVLKLEIGPLIEKGFNQ